MEYISWGCPDTSSITADAITRNQTEYLVIVYTNKVQDILKPHLDQMEYISWGSPDTSSSKSDMARLKR